MSLTNGDFIKIDYSGRFEGKLFDTTEESVAKKEKGFDEKIKYGSITVIVGEKQMLKGIDEALVGKKPGDTFIISLEPENAFGKKNAKLLKIIPEKAFKDQKVRPQAGMTLNIDNLIGHVLSVGSGRVILDFNHPLAGKILDYEVKIHEKIEDKTEQIKALLELYTNRTDFEVSLGEKDATITSLSENKLEEPIKNHISELIKKYIKLENIEFVEKEKETAEKTEKKAEKETKKQTAESTEKETKNSKQTKSETAEEIKKE